MSYLTSIFNLAAMILSSWELSVAGVSSLVRPRGLLFLALAQTLRLRSAVRIAVTGGDGVWVPSPWS